MLEEKVFKKIIMSATLLVIVVVFFSYFMYYKKQPVLKAQNVTQKEETVNFPVDLFEIFSMTRDKVKVKLGNPKKIGNGSDYDNKFFIYEQDWFGKKFDAKYYYGDQDRMYQTNLKMKKEDFTNIYESLKSVLGTPVVDTFFDDKVDDDMKITYWIKDAIRYAMVYDSQDMQPYIKMNIAYYQNPDNHNIGQRPIIIQRMDKISGIMKDNDVNILLIGEKPDYSSTYFKNIYVLIGSKKGSFLGRFDKENDGGYRPSFQINEVDGQKRIVVETDNEYAKLETVFEFVDKKITQISSQEKK